MLGFKRFKKQVRAWTRKEIAREARATMMSYHAARQAFDIYEMRLETIDTRMCKKIAGLETRIAELEATLALMATEVDQPPVRRAG